MFLACSDNISNLAIGELYLIKKHQLSCLEKLSCRELCTYTYIQCTYTYQLILEEEKRTSQTYHEKHF